MSARYVLCDYDCVLVAASWGNPKEWEEAEYLIEVEVRNRGRRRSPERVGDHERFVSSTSALRHSVSSVLCVPSHLLVFAQDTILLDDVMRRLNQYFSDSPRSIARSELLRTLYRKLYEANDKLTRELEVRDPDELREFVVFVPGVVSTREGPITVTWRGEHIYDIISGIVVLEVLRKLETISGGSSARRVAIIADTTHGINYFAAAFISGLITGASLYALRRSPQGAVEELVVYHYNSDPKRKVEGPRREPPSLKLHLLRAVPIVRAGCADLMSLLSLVESRVLIEGLSGLASRIHSFCELGDHDLWTRALATILLFARGVLAWSLRAAEALQGLPTLDKLIKSCGDIKLNFSFSRDKISPRVTYKISYHWGRMCPHEAVVVTSLLAGSLKDLSISIRLSDTEAVRAAVAEAASELRRALEANRDAQCAAVCELLEGWARCARESLCVPLNALKEYARKLYREPYLSINVSELTRLEDHVLGKRRPGWREVLREDALTLIAEPENRAWFIRLASSDVRIVLSNRGAGVDPRNFYAHAGLAYGMDYLVVHSGELGAPVILLGDYRKALELVRLSGG